MEARLTQAVARVVPLFNKMRTSTPSERRLPRAVVLNDDDKWRLLHAALVRYKLDRGDVLVPPSAADAQHGSRKTVFGRTCEQVREQRGLGPAGREAVLDALGRDWRVDGDAIEERSVHARAWPLVARALTQLRRYGTMPCRGKGTGEEADLRKAITRITRTRGGFSRAHAERLNAALLEGRARQVVAGGAASAGRARKADAGGAASGGRRLRSQNGSLV